ncbi:class I fructose-bisphosphate aldolase [Candidatus Pelagibacter bacterium nBUS_36]|uniref:class I fructose-bisphosphate aldolase n=1 Tax=Candidatus Pelagibacter bacterium nBUS_36 TaxID=3374194 RepID=UPI003EB6B8E3
MTELNKIALKILSDGKGILAADESNGTMTKRLESVNITSTSENRLLFRETLFSSECMTECIGGVILYDETINQSSISEKKIPTLISDSGAVPGIKVDTGAKVLANSSEEKITEGLDGLRERLKEYYLLGARFTKWRGVYNISEKYPSKLAINSNAHALARYSALVQECGMVPIVEPEVLMDGDHSADDCLIKTSEVIQKCFDELITHKIDLTGIILKPNMILAGNKSKNKISNEEVSFKTLECLKKSVPIEVPGVAFLSGGQSEIEATENLNLINKNNNTNFIMTYSYGRALQQSALKFWSKNIKDVKGTQNVFNHRAKMNTLAAQGKWSSDLENK